MRHSESDSSNLLGREGIITITTTFIEQSAKHFPFIVSHIHVCNVSMVIGLLQIQKLRAGKYVTCLQLHSDWMMNPGIKHESFSEAHIFCVPSTLPSHILLLFQGWGRPGRRQPDLAGQVKLWLDSFLSLHPLVLSWEEKWKEIYHTFLLCGRPSRAVSVASSPGRCSCGASSCGCVCHHRGSHVTAEQMHSYLAWLPEHLKSSSRCWALVSEGERLPSSGLSWTTLGRQLGELWLFFTEMIFFSMKGRLLSDPSAM